MPRVPHGRGKILCGGGANSRGEKEGFLRTYFPQPAGLCARSVEGGYWPSFSAGRRGRGTSSPPQFGHLPCSTDSAHAAQKVHSKEQIRASVESGGRSLSQHSQLGRSWSMGWLSVGLCFYSGLKLSLILISVSVSCVDVTFRFIRDNVGIQEVQFPGLSDHLIGNEVQYMKEL